MRLCVRAHSPPRPITQPKPKKPASDSDSDGGDDDDDDDDEGDTGKKWYEGDEDVNWKKGDQKWKTLEWNGVLFPPLYEPHRIPFKYDGKAVPLNRDQEEVATMYAQMLTTQYAYASPRPSLYAAAPTPPSTPQPPPLPLPRAMIITY